MQMLPSHALQRTVAAPSVQAWQAIVRAPYAPTTAAEPGSLREIHRPPPMLKSATLRIGVLLLTGLSSLLAAEPSHRPLPPGALSVSDMSQVHAEICRDHLFDPSRVSKQLPPGYRFISAADHAQEDPLVAGLLKTHPKYARYAVGSLCFLSVGAFTVDGTPITAAGSTSMAFWWARAEGPRDARMQGKAEWVQIGSWYSRDITERAKVIATDPMAEFVEIRVDQLQPNAWRLRLALHDEVIEGSVQCTGELTQRRSSGTSFMSVPLSGAGAGSFWVISYFGHHHKKAQGDWRSAGTGVFSEAFQMPDGAKLFPTLFQSGWSARSGLYGGQ